MIIYLELKRLPQEKYGFWNFSFYFFILNVKWKKNGKRKKNYPNTPTVLLNFIQNYPKKFAMKVRDEGWW